MTYRLHIANIIGGKPDQVFDITDPADGLSIVNMHDSIHAFSIPVHEIPELKHEIYFGVSTGSPRTGHRWFNDNPAMIAHLTYTKPNPVQEYPDPNAIEVLSAYDHSRYKRGEVSLEALREEGSVYILHPEPLTPTYENLADYLAFMNSQMYPHHQMLLTKDL